MARGDSVARRIQAQIAASPHVLTLRYPAQRAVVPGVAPVSRPASPLTGAIAAPTLVPAAVTPEEADVTDVHCLWHETPVTQELSRDRTTRNPIGWLAEAHAMARVHPDDVAAFRSVEAVVKAGKRYRVLQIDPMGPSFGEPHSYSVWLVGAVTQ